MTKKILVALAAVASLTLSAFAQDQPKQDPKYVPINPLPLGDILLSLPTAHIPSEGTWEVKFTHRFQQSLDAGNGHDRVHSFFGLDSSADVGIGVSYAPRRDLQFTVVRSNVLDDIEMAGKYVIFQQAPALPVSLAFRGGVDWRTERGLRDRTSLFAQAIISRRLGARTEVFILPTWATNAGRTTQAAEPLALFKHATNVPFGIAFMLKPSLSVVGEFVPKNHDLPKSIQSDFGWSLGLKRAIGGHYFEIMITDLPSTHVDQLVTATYQGGAIKRGDLHLGFNIERRFGK
jgi:Membrane bound beta barrel domain (DUF5777)